MRTVRVVRGRAEDIETDRGVTERLCAAVADGGPPTIRLWTPHRQLAFGRRDATAPGYSAAAAVARTAGFPPVTRAVGGRAVACTDGTLAVAWITPIEGDRRRGIRDRYESTVRAIQRALWAVGVPARRGEPPEAFCPGSHSLQCRGKLAGFGQRVRSSVAMVGGIVIVTDREAIVGVLDRVYPVLSLAFDPDAVGSVERAGGRADPAALASAIEARLVADREPIVDRVETVVDARGDQQD